jgi:L-alanine-DL-glutamate epimerase-like enolase superfamily enzyme
MDRLTIRAVAAAPLSGQSPKGGWSAEIRPDDSVHTLVAVHTEEGITGHGSVFTNGGLVEAALRVLEPLILGENALEPARVSEKLHQNSFWMGRGGTLTHAISGLDIAMWDAAGRALGQPVGRLMGGVWRRRLRPYCSLLAEPPARLEGALAPYLAQGFAAFKIGWGPFGRGDRRSDEAILRAARRALGDGPALMVDAGGSDAFWRGDLKWALETARMLRDHDVAWFEEPLAPDALEDYRELRRQSPVPIAGGEVLTRRQAFLPYLAGRAFDIVQPDATKVGGLSEQKRIAETAEAFGVHYVGHGWNTALGVAADLHLAAALPRVDWVEFIGGSPYVDGLLTEPFRLDAEGCLEIPLGPGLGVALDPARVARHAPDWRRLFAD